ncbi:PREDICTED: vacuolar protein sorting-associated protein 33B-like isoform X3 [Priapulus caudatus]|uniref:Vacuolar protein sorting-associated protein 33B-like isoform X3 n=1 Tax=Priapulus caudatus TaxID=37621 RepID=A0ABM1DVF4_PRICU|nr:PREDICTED: vacuolar protein sorting-associated protein 33B-like isoform X3 [Priapulus caudatus]
MSAPIENCIPLPDLQIFRQLSRDQLVLCLESIPGRKDLVLEPGLMRLLDRIAGASLLKQHGVDKIFKFEGKPIRHGNDQRLYLVRPDIETVKQIAEHIAADKTAGKERVYRIILVPRKDGDQTYVHTVADALINLQSVFGTIPNVYAIGNCSKMVYDMMETLREDRGAPAALKNEIGHLVLIDRDVDYITPLCSQLTYEGLLDEIFGINSGYCDFGPEVMGKDQTIRLLLTCQDEVFDDIRNRHFSGVFNFLSTKAKELASDYEKRKNLATVGEMKDFVANKLKALKAQHKSLALHIGASEHIINVKAKTDFEEHLRTEHSLLDTSQIKENIAYIEEAINRQYPLMQSLRLLCLMSQVLNGLPKNDYEGLTTQFLQSHGFEHMLTFLNLKKLGLLTEQEPSKTVDSMIKTGKMTAAGAKVATTVASAIPRTTSNYSQVCRKLNLIPKIEEVDLKNATDMSYVFSGAFTPITCRLVEKILAKEGFDGLDDVMKLLPGPKFCNIKAKSVKDYRFIIATTAIITGTRLLEGVMES